MALIIQHGPTPSTNQIEAMERVARNVESPRHGATRHVVAFLWRGDPTFPDSLDFMWLDEGNERINTAVERWPGYNLWPRHQVLTSASSWR